MSGVERPPSSAAADRLERAARHLVKMREFFDRCEDALTDSEREEALANAAHHAYALNGLADLGRLLRQEIDRLAAIEKDS